MATNQKVEKLELDVNEVVRYGPEQTLGFIMEIRVIDTAKFVQKFSGGPEEVMLRIRTHFGTALIWPKRHEVQKANEHDTKEFKQKFKWVEDRT